jgi:hypothetical protein
MQNVMCCNHARMRSSAGKATQLHLSQQCAAVKATVVGVRTSGNTYEQSGARRGMHASVQEACIRVCAGA